MLGVVRLVIIVMNSKFDNSVLWFKRFDPDPFKVDFFSAQRSRFTWDYVKPSTDVFCSTKQWGFDYQISRVQWGSK